MIDSVAQAEIIALGTRKVQKSGRNKVIEAMLKNRKKLPLSTQLIGRYAHITSGGYLSTIIKDLVLDGILKKLDCPQCNCIDVYHLVK